MEFLSALTGSFSHPAAGNPTVAMVEAAYRHHGLDFRYINCDVAEDDLGTPCGARAPWVGAASTFRFRTKWRSSIISTASRSPRRSSAPSIVCGGIKTGLSGKTPTARGSSSRSTESSKIPGSRVVVLGAGGAARAIAVELALAGADQITLINRTAAKAETIAALVSERTSAKGAVRPGANHCRSRTGPTFL